jgi:hypothetical protein
MEHGSTIRMLTERQHTVRRSAQVRVGVVIVLTLSWLLMASTGIIMAVGPWGDVEDLQARSSALLLGMNQEQWGEIHEMVGFTTVALSLAHVLVEWRMFRGYLRQVMRR